MMRVLSLAAGLWLVFGGLGPGAEVPLGPLGALAVQTAAAQSAAAMVGPTLGDGGGDEVGGVPWDAAAPPPPRVALQAGHWRSAEAPDELARLRSNGTRGGGRREWEVTLEIARRTAQILESSGYQVEILPATVPPGYHTDLFIAIHADGFHNASASGFSVAAPRRDATGRAGAFAAILAGQYGETTGLRHRAATRRMRGYYAFNSRRYHHALDPRTVGVIIEAGFLTSPRDREILLSAPERSAQGIAGAVTRFLPVPPRAEGHGDW